MMPRAHQETVLQSSSQLNSGGN